MNNQNQTVGLFKNRYKRPKCKEPRFQKTGTYTQPVCEDFLDTVTPQFGRAVSFKRGLLKINGNISTKKGGLRVHVSAFSLIEVMIALTIIGLIAGISIPTISSITHTELKATTSRVSGMIRLAFETAVLNGKPCRVVFDFASQKIRAEQSSNTTFAIITDKQAIRDKQNKMAKTESHGHKSNGYFESLSKRQYGQGADMVASNTHFGNAEVLSQMKLSSNIKMQELMAEHLLQPVKEGEISIYFFPSGYAEHALIYFVDADEQFYGVEVEPLTGRTLIHDKKIDFNDEGL